jgi:integrase/recombinase XerD
VLNMKQAKTLNERELKAVFVQIGTRRFAARDRAIVAVSYYAGLTTSDVVASDGMIRNELVLLASQTKGRESRKIFVSEKLRKELAVYVRTLDANSSRSLFMTQKDNAFTPNAMCHLFRDIYADCGIANASSHSGRRTFITNLASKGVGVRVLAALAGHSSISTTQRYIDINDTQLRSAVELM